MHDKELVRQRTREKGNFLDRGTNEATDLDVHGTCKELQEARNGK